MLPIFFNKKNEMIVNNFNEIKELLIKEDPYDFWFGQIIKRKKDNPLMDRSERIIKSYNFSNHDKLLDRMDEIMSICEYNNARFYLNPNIRNIKLCNIRLIQSLMQSIADESYSSIYSKVDSVLGKTITPGRPKWWIVDIDEKNPDLLNDLKDAIDISNNKTSFVLETINGYHIICEPFNRKVIVYSEIKVNSPTLIYFNKNENN